ncbi:hypothetical protein A0H81_07366 [Grifola frondosa]|uniref:C3H1-type domain-containing protein n=1 Tax=Grifola frondosa TaxID=5627 RepID=A0A1C7M636_GRIFR|nr:hypothetical protein A0H81_07366 [Grifola frondosa]
MLTDDLPWPELGNVSRGATRGNQGHKGSLGPPDSEGRCTLQLRVQPGVLAVRLNRQASDWYNILNNEVNRALKLTKTFWRKARRRQDYDHRADQDHMELHEWLQQLKDKVISHLEVLLQKGEIQGPPYNMPENVEITFLRKFIERQAAGIPHNPRLRRAYIQSRPAGTEHQQLSHNVAGTSSTPISIAAWNAMDDQDDSAIEDNTPSAANHSQTDHQSLISEVASNRRLLADARLAWSHAQKETKEAFAKYSACLDAESKARQQVTHAEERRDTLMASLVEGFRGEYMESSDISAKQSPAADESQLPRSESRASTSQSHDDSMNAIHNGVALQDAAWKNMREMHWPPQNDAMGHEADVVDQNFSPAARRPDLQMGGMGPMERKHPRDWELQGALRFKLSSVLYENNAPQGQAAFEVSSRMFRTAQARRECAQPLLFCFDLPKLCRNFALGHCPQGEECNFIHANPPAWDMSTMLALSQAFAQLAVQNGLNPQMSLTSLASQTNPWLWTPVATQSADPLTRRRESLPPPYFPTPPTVRTLPSMSLPQVKYKPLSRKTTLCRHFVKNKGWCPLNNECNYIHDKDLAEHGIQDVRFISNRSGSSTTPTQHSKGLAGSKQSHCWAYVQDKCHVRDCPYLHPVAKHLYDRYTPCLAWPNCFRGIACPYKHPELHVAPVDQQPSCEEPVDEMPSGAVQYNGTTYFPIVPNISLPSREDDRPFTITDPWIDFCEPFDPPRRHRPPTRHPLLVSQSRPLPPLQALERALEQLRRTSLAEADLPYVSWKQRQRAGNVRRISVAVIRRNEEKKAAESAADKTNNWRLNAAPLDRRSWTPSPLSAKRTKTHARAHSLLQAVLFSLPSIYVSHSDVAHPHVFSLLTDTADPTIRHWTFRCIP